VHPSWTPATFELGFFAFAPEAIEKLNGTTATAAVAAAAPRNLRLEIFEFVMILCFFESVIRY
jgi:hypothetical protein